MGGAQGFLDSEATLDDPTMGVPSIIQLAKPTAGTTPRVKRQTVDLGCGDMSEQVHNGDKCALYWAGRGGDGVGGAGGTGEVCLLPSQFHCKRKTALK